MNFIHKQLRITWFFFFISLSFFVYGQNSNDSITISKEELRQIIREEVQKELQKINSAPLETVQTTSTETKEQNQKLIGERIKFSGTGLIRAGEWDFKQNEINPSTGEVKQLHKRFWTRMNLYLNVDAKLVDNLDFHARLRTGQKQYSFVTFGENVDERFNIIMDQLWLNYKLKNYEFRAGRQDAGRIWTNQKGVQFDIPSHDGLTIVADYKLGNVSLSPRIAYFFENYKNNSPYREQGKVYGASIRAAQSNENLTWKAETGIIKAEKLPTRYVNDLAQKGSEIKYHDGDLAPDYSIWTNQISLNFPRLRNLTFVVDYYHNFKNYIQNPVSHMIHDTNGINAFSNSANFNSNTAPDFRNQKNGFVASISTGNLSVPKNIWASLSYLYMEKYAAMDYFAQYDYTRWASTNIQGPEVSVGYRFNKYLQFRTRFFISNEIKGYYATNPGYKKSEDRIRFDLNINF